MPRIVAVPFAAALTGAIFLALATAPEAFAQEPVSREDYDALVERLNRAEAEIQSLKQMAPSEHAEPTLADDAPFDAAEPEGLSSQLHDLNRRFEEFRQSITGKMYPTIEVHGAVQADSGWYGQDIEDFDKLGNLIDGADFRRTRIGVNGAIAPNMNYFVQMDYAFPGRPSFTDVWVELTELPLLGNLRIGQWKQPFSLEVVSSFRYTLFPERSLLFQAFAPFRHIAVGFYNWSEDERMTWAASVYRSGQDQYGDSIADSGGYAGVGRVTALPYYEDDGENYLHLGAAYNYVAPNDRRGGFRTIPEFFIGHHDPASAVGTAGVAIPGVINGTPFFVNTGNFGINHYNLAGTELLWVDGPLSVQSEFQYLVATRTNDVGANFGGFYTQVGYFLTGEHRPYLRQLGAIDRIKVLCDLGYNEETGYGWGAWEAATRWSYIDLDSKDIRGGRLFDWTAGLNWYLNSYAKIQLQYVRASLDNPTFGHSVTDMYSIRAQWDF